MFYKLIKFSTDLFYFDYVLTKKLAVLFDRQLTGEYK